jgi:hypothetical protein
MFLQQNQKLSYLRQPPAFSPNAVAFVALDFELIPNASPFLSEAAAFVPIATVSLADAFAPNPNAVAFSAEDFEFKPNAIVFLTEAAAFVPKAKLSAPAAAAFSRML